MITTQDLLDRFGEQELINLTDHDSYQAINQAVLEKAIADAEADIASYLQAVGLVTLTSHGKLKYLPAPSAPKSLIIKACDITRYYLHENGVTEIVEKRYDLAIAWLKLVMKTPEMLTGPSTASGDRQSAGIVVIPNQPPNYWGD